MDSTDADRSVGKKYKGVYVLMLSWQLADVRFHDQLEELKEVFEAYYHYTAYDRLIPKIDAQTTLDNILAEFLVHDDDENLLILYYGGHGDIDSDRQAIWKWSKDCDRPRVMWGGLQTKLFERRSDILMLLDCCAAASSVSCMGQGMLEVIYASGFSGKTPLAGEHTFTANLIEELKKPYSYSLGIPTVKLSLDLATALKHFRPTKKKEQRVTPHHFWLAYRKEDFRSIRLQRIDAKTNIRGLLSDALGNPANEEYSVLNSAVNPYARNSIAPFKIEDMKWIVTASLQRFLINLSEKEEGVFRRSTIQDVRHTMANIQEVQRLERRIQNMTRIEIFLDSLVPLGKHLTNLLRNPDFIAVIWGSINFLLQATEASNVPLDKLLDVYEKLGEAFPGIPGIQENTAELDHVFNILALLYTDILEFHARALAFFKHKSWKSAFQSAWDRFDVLVRHLLDNIKCQKSIIESGTIQDQIGNYLSQRTIAEQRLKNAENSERKRMMISVIEKISSVNCEADHELVTKFWRKTPEFCHWFFQSTKMLNWLNTENDEVQKIWLNGMPGAGKTVMASRIIEELRMIDQSIVLFYFFKYEDSQRNSFRALLKGLLAQAIHYESDIFSHIFDQCSQQSGATLESVKLLTELAEMALGGTKPIHIVLDGLNECNKQEKKNTVAWLDKMIKNSTYSGTSNARIRVLIVSQDEDGIARKSVPYVTLNNSPGHIEAIRLYTKRKSRKIREEFGLTKETEDRLIETVTNRADGMFLFAKLVLKHLQSQVSLSEFIEELEDLEDEKVKICLDDLYDRIFDRINKNPSQSERDAARRIMSWIVSAKRPLQLNEIQAMFSVDLIAKNVEFEHRRLRKDIKQLCGSLIEVSSTNTVKLVHYTVKHYLVSKKQIDIISQEMKMTTLCLGYLNLPCFEPGISDIKIREYYLSGYYALQEYAIAHWIDHLGVCLSFPDTPKVSDLDKMMELIDEHLAHFSLDVIPTQHDNGPNSAVRHRIFMYNTFFTQNRRQKEDSKIENQKTYQPNVLKNLRIRRSVMEKTIAEVVLHAEMKEKLQLFYGFEGSWFKCLEMHCLGFHEGFQSQKIRDKHFQNHARSFRCPFTSCPNNTIGYASLAQLKRHQRKNHAILEDDDLPTANGIREIPQNISQHRRETPEATFEYYGGFVDHPSLFDELPKGLDFDSDRLVNPGSNYYLPDPSVQFMRNNGPPPSPPMVGIGSPRYQPVSNLFRPTSPAYQPVSPMYRSTSPAKQDSRPPPTSPQFSPFSPPYRPVSPIYNPTSPAMQDSHPPPTFPQYSYPPPTSPQYSSFSPAYLPVSPTYNPTSPAMQDSRPPPTSPQFSPTTPGYYPMSPIYNPTSLAMQDSRPPPTSPQFSPTTPGYYPMSPIYNPTSPAMQDSRPPPTSPQFSPSSPGYSPALTMYNPTLPAMQDSRPPPASPQFSPSFP